MKGDYFKLYREDLWNGVPLNDAKTLAYDRIKSDWGGKLSEIPAFVGKKTIWAWQDDVIPLQYCNERYMGLEHSTPITQWTYDQIQTTGKTISQLYYCLTMFLGLITMGVWICRKDRENSGFLLITLLLVGFYCLMLLSEVQSRYKCLVVPFICILDAYALMWVIDRIRGITIKR